MILTQCVTQTDSVWSGVTNDKFFLSFSFTPAPQNQNKYNEISVLEREKNFFLNKKQFKYVIL